MTPFGVVLPSSLGARELSDSARILVTAANGCMHYEIVREP